MSELAHRAGIAAKSESAPVRHLLHGSKHQLGIVRSDRSRNSSHSTGVLYIPNCSVTIPHKSLPSLSTPLPTAHCDSPPSYLAHRSYLTERRPISSIPLRTIIHILRPCALQRSLAFALSHALPLIALGANSRTNRQEYSGYSWQDNCNLLFAPSTDHCQLAYRVAWRHRRQLDFLVSLMLQIVILCT